MSRDSRPASWTARLRAGRIRTIQARALLMKAIDTYVQGFQADWRDAYPGINAVQLMELRDPPDPRQAELLPVVTFSVKRRIESGQPGYWDYAALLELALLDVDEETGADALSGALAADPMPWQARSTLETVQRLQFTPGRSRPLVTASPGCGAAWPAG